MTQRDARLQVESETDATSPAQEEARIPLHAPALEMLAVHLTHPLHRTVHISNLICTFGAVMLVCLWFFYQHLGFTLVGIWMDLVFVRVWRKHLPARSS